MSGGWALYGPFVESPSVWASKREDIVLTIPAPSEESHIDTLRVVQQDSVTEYPIEAGLGRTVWVQTSENTKEMWYGGLMLSKKFLVFVMDKGEVFEKRKIVILRRQE